MFILFSEYKGVKMSQLPELVKIVVEQLQEKKAEDLAVLDVRKMVNYTDYLVIATGNSAPHVQTLADTVAKLLKKPEEGIKQESDPTSNWLLIDGGEFILHVFQPNARK